ncbi:uncharacterized protein LOC108602887 isoform X4 [Drosophila busckii]|nr:uncharacterized protein LOC108602887 isoform X4 [Drosophila busckii]
MYLHDERPPYQQDNSKNDNSHSQDMQTDKSYVRDKLKPMSPAHSSELNENSEERSKDLNAKSSQTDNYHIIKPQEDDIPSVHSQTDASYIYDRYMRERPDNLHQQQQRQRQLHQSSQTHVKRNLSPLRGIHYPTHYNNAGVCPPLKPCQCAPNASAMLMCACGSKSNPMLPNAQLQHDLCKAKSAPSELWRSLPSHAAPSTADCGCDAAAAAQRDFGCGQSGGGSQRTLTPCAAQAPLPAVSAGVQTCASAAQQCPSAAPLCPAAPPCPAPPQPCTSAAAAAQQCPSKAPTFASAAAASTPAPSTATEIIFKPQLEVHDEELGLVYADASLADQTSATVFCPQICGNVPEAPQPQPARVTYCPNDPRVRAKAKTCAPGCSSAKQPSNTQFKSAASSCTRQVASPIICSCAEPSHITTSAYEEPMMDCASSQQQQQTPYSHASFGCPERTSSRSRSVMDKVTCLCSSVQRATLGRLGQHDNAPPFLPRQDAASCCAQQQLHEICLLSSASYSQVLQTNKSYKISAKRSSKSSGKDMYRDCDSSSNTSINEPKSLVKYASKLCSKKQSHKSKSAPSCDCSGEPHDSSMRSARSCSADLNSKSLSLKSALSKTPEYMDTEASCSCDKQSAVMRSLPSSPSCKSPATYVSFPSCSESAPMKSLPSSPSCKSPATHGSCEPPAEQHPCVQADCKCYTLNSSAICEEESVGVVMQCGKEASSCADTTGESTFEQSCRLCETNVQSLCTRSMPITEPSCGCDLEAAPANRKQRILALVEQLSLMKECHPQRPEMIRQLFGELTLMLRDEAESAKLPQDEPPRVPPTFEECIEAKEAPCWCEQTTQRSKTELQRLECFNEMEKYLEHCLLKSGTRPTSATEIGGFEFDPEFDPYRAGQEDSQTFKDCHEPEEHFAGTCEEEEATKADTTTGTTGAAGLEESAGGKSERTDFTGKSESTAKSERTERTGKSERTDFTFKSERFEYTGESVTIPACIAAEETLPAAESETEEPAQIAARTGSKRGSQLQSADGSKRGSQVVPQAAEPTDAYQLVEEELVVIEEETIVVIAGQDGDEALAETEPQSAPHAGQLCAMDAGGALGQLTERECLLMEYMLRRMCQYCEEEQQMQEDDGGGEGYDDECDCEANYSQRQQQQPGGCLCCHCRAMICENQCKSVTKTMDAVSDPVGEMKYFIDSIIFDLQSMDQVLNKKKIKPKGSRSKQPAGNAPGDSFPVTIAEVSSLGCAALFIRWEVHDCTAIAGYEIYVDGHLTNRFYSFRHEAGVVSNVDVTKMHQIVLRAQATGQDFPGEECGNAVAHAHPELLAGASRPWKPSIYFYDPDSGVAPPRSSSKKKSEAAAPAETEAETEAY